MLRGQIGNPSPAPGAASLAGGCALRVGQRQADLELELELLQLLCPW